MTTDWTTIGHAECSDTSELTHSQVRTSLLPHNTTRNIVEPIVLVSNISKAAGFVMPNLDLKSASPRNEAQLTSGPSVKDTNPCTDFILVGWAEEGDAGVPLTDAVLSLTVRKNEGSTRSTVLLVSNHARCTHFVTDGKCSAELTNHDVLWMESVASCKPGTLFKRFRTAASGPPSKCELPWDPERRYVGLCATKVLRTPRGHKSTEHLENLRLSDPLINPTAWHDWAALTTQFKSTRPARVHQQALIDRAFYAHARNTTTTVRIPSPIGYAGEYKSETFKSTNALKRAMHLDRLRTVDEYEPRQAERYSNDSVMAHYIEAPPFDASPTQSPTGQKPLPPTTPLGSMSHDGKLDCGERSPTSVVSLPAHIEKEFPPLPAKLGKGKFIESALHQYKVASDGPAWYSDA